jgi:His/Glu/Gln/Arg/opine family amino acid ABC transporter permease subunit
MDFKQYVFGEPYFGWLLRGVEMALVISILSGILAIVLGYFILLCQLSPNRFLRILGIGYVVIFRNIPLLPLLLFLMFGVPGVWKDFTGSSFPRNFEFYFLLAGMGLNTGAYIAEILKAGVKAVSPGQTEVSKMLGLSQKATQFKVVFPQAIRIVAPALASRIIHNTKNSTMALIIPLQVDWMEVVGQAGRIAGQTFTWVEPLAFAAVVHLILALGIGKILNHWALQQQKHVEVTP